MGRPFTQQEPLGPGAVKTPWLFPSRPPSTLPGGLWALHVAEATARKRLSPPRALECRRAMARGLRETPFSPRPSLRWPGRRNRPSKATGVSQQVLAELWQGPGKVAGGVSGVQDWGGGGGTSSLDHPSLSLFWGLQLAAGPPGSFQHFAFCSDLLSCPQTLTHCAGHRPRLRVLISPSWAFGQFFSFLFFFFFYGRSLSRFKRWTRLRLSRALAPHGPCLSSVPVPCALSSGRTPSPCSPHPHPRRGLWPSQLLLLFGDTRKFQAK